MSVIGSVICRSCVLSLVRQGLQHMQISDCQNWYKRSNLSIVVWHLLLNNRIVQTSVLTRREREKWNLHIGAFNTYVNSTVCHFQISGWVYYVIVLFSSHTVSNLKKLHKTTTSSVIPSLHSQPLTTFIMEWGCFMSLRMPQGYLAFDDAYTRRYDKIIKNIPRKIKIVNDTLLFNKNIEDTFYHTLVVREKRKNWK